MVFWALLESVCLISRPNQIIRECFIYMFVLLTSESMASVLSNKDSTFNHLLQHSIDGVFKELQFVRQRSNGINEGAYVLRGLYKAEKLVVSLDLVAHHLRINVDNVLDDKCTCHARLAYG